MSQIWPETGESLANFQITNQNLFVLSPVFLLYLIDQKRLSKVRYFEIK